MGRPTPARSRLWALPVALLALLTLPSALRPGPFFDGLTFASIARNLAEGKGAFWAPHYTEIVHPQWFDSLPLGLWLQSWVYRLFGDHLALDSVWNLAMGPLLVLLLVPLWRRLPPGQGPIVGTWWPALLVLCFPLTGRALRNNLMEPTMTVFALAAAALAMLGLGRRGVAAPLGWGVMAGALLVAALLSKGPQGLFPLVLPLLAALCFQPVVPWRAALGCTAAMTGTVIGGVALLHASGPAAQGALDTFLSGQVLASLEGRRELASSHWSLLEKLGPELALPLAIAGAGALLARSSVRLSGNRRFWFFLAVACSASLPFLLSPKQYGRYIFPSLPFFALALAALFEPVARRAELLVGERRAWRRGVTGAALVAGAVAVSLLVLLAGTPRREPDFFADLPQQGVRLDGRPMVSVCPADLATAWALVANMQRVYRASLTPEAGMPLLLVEKAGACPIPPGCEPLQPAPPTRYLLFRCPTAR